jgi:hypothetical protein
MRLGLHKGIGLMRLALLLSVAALCGFSGSAAAAAVPLDE